MLLTFLLLPLLHYVLNFTSKRVVLRFWYHNQNLCRIFHPFKHFISQECFKIWIFKVLVTIDGDFIGRNKHYMRLVLSFHRRNFAKKRQYWLRNFHPEAVLFNLWLILNWRQRLFLLFVLTYGCRLFHNLFCLNFLCDLWSHHLFFILIILIDLSYLVLYSVCLLIIKNLHIQLLLWIIVQVSNFAAFFIFLDFSLIIFDNWPKYYVSEGQLLCPHPRMFVRE